MNTEQPIREWGRWAEMTPQSINEFLERGTNKVFDPDLRESVSRIINDVNEHGDTALVRALEDFDSCTITRDQIRISSTEIDEAFETVSETLLAAIRDSIEHVRAFNEQIMKNGDWSFETEPGLEVGERVSPIESVGLFVPSGKASYPSVLVQIGTPAVVAGVPHIAVVVPPKPGSSGEVDPAVLVVAKELGITEVFRTNGPAGIAALSSGTETIPQVRKVLGPGSPAVTVAQIEVQKYGTISHMLLGPSESLILADSSADPYLLAADLLNEAEHGTDSTSVLVTNSQDLLASTQKEIAAQLQELPPTRRSNALAALGTNGGAVLADDLDQACEVVNRFAPEHMQIAVDAKAEQLVLGAIEHAGEILLGQSTTISMANYVIGCPAALPTSGFAKVTGGVTSDAFRKRTAIARATPAALKRTSQTVLAFTEHEGFPAHGAAVSRRLES